jgi:hypothetical protein
MNENPTSLSREELYERIWAKPVRDIASEFGISDVGLAKICDRLNIPRPPRGYWARLAAGQKPRRPPLPPTQIGDELEWAIDGRSPRRMAGPIPALPDGNIAPVANIKLPKRHPLLSAVEPLFLKTRSDYGTHLRPSKRALVDICVSKSALSRALEVANTIFLGLERRGYKVELARDHALRRPSISSVKEVPDKRESYDTYLWNPSSPTVVYIGTVAFSLTMYEMTENVEMRHVNGQYVRVGQESQAGKRRNVSMGWTTWQDVPSGRLCLIAASAYEHISWRHEWKEKAAGELPEAANDMASILVDAIPKVLELIKERDRLAEEQRKAREEQHQRWRAEEDRKQKAAAVKESVEEISALAEAWSGRVRIEAFFADAEQCSEKLPEEERVKIRARIRRARSLLNQQNPLERFQSWRSPEDRLPPELWNDLPAVSDSEIAEEEEDPEPQSNEQVHQDHPKSYWETRHWWQRR